MKNSLLRIATSKFQFTSYMRVISYSTHPLCSVYSTIDPKEAFANQTYRGKVVLITYRNIGQETAITYAMAGGSATIAGRSQENLDKTASVIHAVGSGTCCSH